MQDMDPGPAKILHKPEKGDTKKMLQPRMKRPVADSAANTGKLAKNIKTICLQRPIWKVSCHRSIISGLLGSFNGKWQGFLMVRSESELRLVDIYCLHFLVKQNLFERSNWVNLHGAARLRNNFCQEKNYITFKNNSCTCQN